MNIKNTIKNTLSILVAFAILFSGIPILTGSAEVDAATPYWKGYAVKSSSYTNNTISWKGLTAKQKKKISGIAIFQGTNTKNLKCVKRIGKGNKAYKNANVRPGVRYCYQLRTYTVKKVKQKQYYNKKTRKWQTKKIKKAKTRRVNVPKYVYSNKSSVKWVTTARKPVPNSPSKPPAVTGLKASNVTKNTIDISWNKANGAFTGYEVYKGNARYCSIGSGGNSVRINNLSKGTKYTLKVRTYKTVSGSTSYGDFASTSATTESDSTPVVVNVTPDTVTGLKATSVTSNSCDVSWNKLTKNVTGYEVRVNDNYYREVGSGTNALPISNLTKSTTYKIKVRAYYKPTATTQNYGGSAEITVTTEETGSDSGNDNPGTNPGNDNPGESTEATFNYKDIPFSPKKITLKNGIVLSRHYNPDLVKLTDAWMKENLPEDATDAEKVNMCLKCMQELHNTPESLEIIDGWWYDNNCTTRASYFNTCAYSAGLVSSLRDCVDDETYGAPFIETHVNNFVWIDGKGYIIDAHGQAPISTLTVINYDWQNLHIITTNKRFDCRYF